MPHPTAAASSEGPIETDALVVGAGPAGLFQVFQLGLLGIHAHVIDSLPHAGGQCTELYADKPIYDIPAVPVCTGRELTASLLRQIAPFQPAFHLGQEVAAVQPQADGRFHVATSQGTRFLAKTVFVAGGVGSFQPRKLHIDGLAAHEGTQVFYRLDAAAPPAGQRWVVVGGDDAALEAALRLAQPGPAQAASVTLLHRRTLVGVAPNSLATMHALCAAGHMQFRVGQVTGIEEAEGRLNAVRVTGADGLTQPVPLDHLLVCLGVSPKLGPIAEWGLALERKQLVVDPATCQTSVPGVFAVGDVNTYPGKRKLIVCAFHEATLAAYAAAALVFPDQPVQLQYTTTSPRLHQRLGVATPPAS